MSQCLNPDCLQQNPDGTKFCQRCGSKLLLAERYRALRILGEGGFGRTFLAVDEYKPSKPRCVIKQFLPQAQGTNNAQKASELFAQEAVRLEDLGKHPQIPELMAYFTQDERQYLVQEFIDGQNLADELADKGAFNEQQIRELLNDLLSVLHFVHANKVIHRDIKPENIIRRKSDNKLVLVDFGAAKFAAKTSISVTGTVIGSVEYTAPEQARGKPKFASDLYSLGVSCIHLLTQITPFELFDVSEGDWVWRQYLVDNPVSDELGEILDKLIETATKRRYQSVEEVLTALNPKLLQGVKLTSKLTPTPQPVISKNRVSSLRTSRADYIKLRDLLAAGKWKEADWKTYRLMLTVVGREKQGWFRVEDIDNFPCEDLRAIDQLWVKYSSGRFGFSVQKRIYQSLGGTREYDKKILEAFGDRVGWRGGGFLGLGRDWKSYSELTFKTKAPKGHLPRWLDVREVGGWGGWWFSIFSRAISIPDRD